MEPANLAGEPFTPSLHPEELLLDDVSPEPEDEDETISINEARLGLFISFSDSNVPVPLAAIDAGVIDVGLSRRGFALAFKAAVIIQDLDNTHTVAKIGPRVKFIEPDDRAELLRFVGRELMARQLQNGILLVDGALTLRTYNTPQVFLEC